MINYVVTAGHSYTIRKFIEHWASDLAPRFNVLVYEGLAQSFAESGHLRLPAGTYIFSDIERLSKDQRAFAGSVATEVSRLGFTVLNHPVSSLRRFELLRNLYEQGINAFNVYRIDEKPQRFPVFIRAANDHSGSRSELLYSDAAVQAQLDQVCRAGLENKEWMIVEFVDTADENSIFRKFSSHLVNDIFVADHVVFQRHWIAKFGGDFDDDVLHEEESKFVRASQNVHEKQVRRIFDLAGIKYGRIDYSFANGKLQVWEINTNPMISELPDAVVPKRLELVKYFANRMRESFLAIDDDRSGVLVVSLPRPGDVPVVSATAISRSLFKSLDDPL